jgi:pimeloyl-ACP methyl ester carboxylesterase
MNRISIAMILFVFCGCGPEGERTTTSPNELGACAPYDAQINPSETHVPGKPAPGTYATFSPDDEHVVKRPPLDGCPGAPKHHSLVVFLPGAHDVPVHYPNFLEHARSRGFHVIGLGYLSDVSLKDTCENDPACPGKYRDELTFGRPALPEGLGPDIEDHPEDSIDERLKAVLHHLTMVDPDGKWWQFLEFGKKHGHGFQPRYRKIVFAGHSLGTGFAAYYARHKNVRRMLMLGGPLEMPPFEGTADWYFEPFRTKGFKLWGLVHVNNNKGDPESEEVRIDNLNQVKRNWRLAGVPRRHRQVVDGDELCGMGAHYAVANCEVYEERWTRMLGSP